MTRPKTESRLQALSKIWSRFWGPQVMKGYLVLFICMVTKAMHLELGTSFSIEAFVMTLKSFLSPRGNPNVIYSDNAINFVGTRNYLRNVYDFFQKPEATNAIKEFLSPSETQWKFNPHISPSLRKGLGSRC